MRHPKIIIASLGLAAVAAVGGITAASVGSSSAASVSPARATVRTAPATVAGKADTAIRSLVTGGLAQLWPPLTSAAPAATGVSGKLAVLNDVNGQQVTYNGHPLYTFADDAAGQVTGQGVQDFFVVTPGLAPLTTSAAPAAPAPQSGVGY
jgi:predicted lipoprotein with Yx(FWY)xxD motif